MINVRITVKGHAHLQTLTKHLQNFKKDLDKNVDGVAVTRFPVTIPALEKVI